MRTPVIFVGHGSPMNAIETNEFTHSWKELMKWYEAPKAIVFLSAHWSTNGETRVWAMQKPDMIYDMYGFPNEMYSLQYPAPGSDSIVKKITTLAPWIHPDATRGFDHGIWSVLMHMYPDANIPVIPVSLDYSMDPKMLFELWRTLRDLRDEGVLIMGSGNIVHNLRAIDWSGNTTYPWAEAFDAKITTLVENRDFDELFRFKEWGDITRLSHPSYDHLLPLFPLLGATYEDESPTFFTPKIVMGNISMRSIRWA